MRHSIKLFLLTAFLVFAHVVCQEPETATTPEPTPVSATPLATAANAEAEADTNTDPEATKAPEAKDADDEGSFNFWHRIFSPLAGIILVVAVILVIFFFWRRRRHSAFVEAVHDTQPFRDDQI